MDFIKKILDLFNEAGVEFPFDRFDLPEDEINEMIVTIHTKEDGKIVFNLFDKDEWAMVEDICQLTEQMPSEVVPSLDLDNNTRTIVIDPKDYE
jgi:hypothetical protein